MRPAAGETYPFLLARAKRLLPDLSIAMQLWDLHEDEQKKPEPNWAGGVYVPNAAHVPGCAMTSFAVYKASELQCRVSINGRSSSAYKVTIPRQGANGQTLVKFWMERYLGGPDYELASDEVIPQKRWKGQPFSYTIDIFT